MDLHEMLDDFVHKHEEYEAARRTVMRYAGKLVRRERESLGLSQSQYGREIGIIKAYLSQMERGVVIVSPEVAKRIIGKGERE